MTIPPNTTLGHYTIISKIGDGGMGGVYRARDVRLDREVAIKILPHSYSSDVAVDGRFLILEENFKQPTTLHVQAIFNWAEEVKRRVPASRLVNSCAP